MLSGFDHVTIAVADLEAASESYSALFGARPVWEGAHEGLGTRAVLFGLSNSLIELVAPSDAPESEGLRSLLAARGEGILTLAFETNDATGTSAELRERGLRASPPESGEAQSSTGERRSYRTLELSPRATRGLSVLAVEREDSAELRGARTADPSVVDALDHVVVRTASAEAAIELYERKLGLRLALDRRFEDLRMLFFRIGGVTVEVVEHESVGPVDLFYGLCHRVRDLRAAHERLASKGFSISEVRPGRKPGTEVFTVKSGTCGVRTLMLRDPARE